MHRAQSIRDAIYDAISPLESLGALSEVYKGAEPPQQLPAVSVFIGEESVLARNSAFIDWQLTIYTDISVRSKLSDIDAEMLTVKKEVHKAIMSDNTLGLTYVMETFPSGQQEPERSNEGDQYSSTTRVIWQVNYRTSLIDPEN